MESRREIAIKVVWAMVKRTCTLVSFFPSQSVEL
jgi:hypothetical protein